jgi:hypothetical protein
MRAFHQRTRRTLLIATVALLMGAPAMGQNASQQRADMLAGKRQADGVVIHVDTIGRIVVVDGRSYLLAAGIAPGSINVGQAVTVAFEPSDLGSMRRATRITPR